MSVLNRLLDYVCYDTQSDETTGTVPSTEKQKVLAAHLVEEMKAIGIEDAFMDHFGYVYGTVPANCERKNTIGFIAHMDTASECSDENVRPRVITNYDGKDIVLNEELGIVTSIKDFPGMARFAGKTLVVTDGTTLLGADDKAGVAEILQACEEIMKEGIPHGKIRIAFTPDEEIGSGADHFDVAGFGCDFAYTVDGTDFNELEYENFNAASARVSIKGVSVHPGDAKNKMINAATVAMEFHSLLPKFEVPENTCGYEGFAHLVGMEGACENASLAYIVRDHDRAKFEARKERFVQAAAFINQKYGKELVQVVLKDSYYNMLEQILPHMDIIELAKKAILEVGAEPKISPVRGGTDGARLSYMGLPCPNLGTGSGNLHGKHEYACAEDMETSVRILKNIIRSAE